MGYKEGYLFSAISELFPILVICFLSYTTFHITYSNSDCLNYIDVKTLTPWLLPNYPLLEVKNSMMYFEHQVKVKQ